MRIALIGLGYIGLPTALLLAKGGHEIVGFDVDAKKIDGLKQGQLPFIEDGLPALFTDAKTRFQPTNRLELADAYIIAVPTPVTADHRCDLSYVERAAESVLQLLKPGDLVVLESTVSPGTTEGIVKEILERAGLRAGIDFSLAYVSEKAIPGNTIHEMVHNDRIIGGIDEASRKKTAEIYKSFVQGEVITTNCRTAETVKLIENSYRDVNIAFANELARVLPEIGVNTWEAIALANRHPRVHVHEPGPGVGGHCIPLDPWFLIEQDLKKTRLLQEARRVNDAMPIVVADAADRLAKKHGTKTIGMLGVAYKKNVDDARETPAIVIMHALQAKGYEVIFHDPYVKVFDQPLLSFEEFLARADGIVMVTDHDAYRTLTFGSVQQWLIDSRGLYRGISFPFEYLLLGYDQLE